MSEDFELENDDIDENDIDYIPMRRMPDRSQNKRGQKPIENADELPLFQHADKKQANCVSYIKVIKTNRPNHGYKGALPPTSTEETLLREYGPGVYTLMGCNDQHKVIIEQHEVYIAGDDSDKKDQSPQNQQFISDRNQELAIKMAHTQATESAKRQEETHRTMMKLLTDQNEHTQNTLQKFFDKTQTTQGDFFTAMQSLNNESKTQMAQMFQQTMAIMMTGHQQSMEFLRASNDRERELNNPMVFVQLLMQGLQMGKEISDSQDQEPWVTALKEGSSMLSNLTQLKAGSAIVPPKLPNPPNPVIKGQLPQKISQSGTQATSQKKPVFTKDEIHKVLQLKKKLNEKGLELSKILDDIEIVFQSPDEPIPDDQETSDEYIPDENGLGNTDTDDNSGDSERSPNGTESV